MLDKWTFGRKIAFGFIVVLALSLLTCVVGIYALKKSVASKDRVLEVNAQNLIDVERVRAAIERKGSATRAFLLTQEERFVDQMQAAHAEFYALLTRLRRVASTNDDKRLLETLEQSEIVYRAAVERVIKMQREGAGLAAISQAFDKDILTKREIVDKNIANLAEFEENLLNQGKANASEAAETATVALVLLSSVALLLSVLLSVFLTRALTRQIGSAVQHVQSSSAELQSSANQQATGAKEQATAMSEITTTISELMATSRQIAESSQRVAQIADDTAKSARGGEQMVVRTNDSIGTIKRQVDLIVAHMLDLGKKSQQIGGILEIINELAEQTNILAINATIEAAGAGDAGKRFSVVADEIRKLADRVGGSTKEIRGLIDEIRAAVNATVMTTEGGTKAVDAGSRHFSDVAIAFKQIVGMVSTTTEASREIELSTKQQATAVEQVNLAIANVAQATKETEASSTQTYQTASQLTSLSQKLLRLIQPSSNA